MNLYNVYDVKAKKQILHLAHRKEVIEKLGIAQSNIYKAIDTDTLYKDRYRIEPVADMPENETLIEWDRYCKQIRRQVNPRILRKITFYGVNERGEVIR